MVTLWLTCLTVVSSIKSLTTLTFSIDACSAILTRWVTNTYSKHNYIKNKKGSRRSTKLLTIQPSWLLNPYTITFFFSIFSFFIFNQTNIFWWCSIISCNVMYGAFPQLLLRFMFDIFYYCLLSAESSSTCCARKDNQSDMIVILLKLLILSHLLP